MSDITKETITTNRGSNSSGMQPEKRDATSYQTASYAVYFIFGILEVLLAFRFVFKLLGAGTTSGFVDFIYNLSSVFTAPFAGVFSTSVAPGAETVSVFEPASLVALIVYALLAWGIVVLIRVLSGRQQEE